MKTHNFEVTIYVEDTDYTGLVYHPNYLKYMERARMHWFEQFDTGLEKQKQAGFYYVIKDIALEYIKPARLDDRLNVRTTVENIGRLQLRFHQEIDNVNTSESPITTADITVVCVDKNIKPQRLPKTLLAKLNENR